MHCPRLGEVAGTGCSWPCGLWAAVMSQLELAPCESDARWEELVAEQPEATVFHRTAWLHLIARLSGSHLRLYEIHGPNGVFGEVPLFFFRRGPLRLAASPPPQAAAPYLGPTVAPGLLPQALAAMAREAKRYGAAYVECRSALVHRSRKAFGNLALLSSPAAPLFWTFPSGKNGCGLKSSNPLAAGPSARHRVGACWWKRCGYKTS